MATTWPANSRSIQDLYWSLDYEFKTRLESNGCSLFRLLKRPYSDARTLGPLVDILLSYYDCTHNVFIFGSHRLRITLEDVLFITGLPISGKPVISSSGRGTDAFQRLFGPESSGKYLRTMELIKSYATNKGDNDKRMIAVLLYVISKFITPISDVGCQFDTTYVEFVENLVEVDSYAWGAALLAFLYTGIKKWKDDKRDGKTELSIDGNVWLLLCFFFIRIPKLMSAVGVELEMIVENVRIVYKNNKRNYKKDVVNILNSLSEEDIRWLPYDSSWLPPRLQDQYQFRALVAPLFCNNYVVHHRPQLVPKQFGLTVGSVAGFERYDYEIKIKHNKGPDNPDYLTFYMKEIELWEQGKLLQDFISGKRSADVAEASSPRRKKSKINVLQEQVAREQAEKTGPLTRFGKEENEQKIRLLESKIKNLEAREEKLNSELRTALERNGRFQSQVEKLMSEVRFARDMNVMLEGENKSSEAREEKLLSEMRAALEMNVKLKGEIKSSEARKEKLMSEVRAALEMNVKLKGEIKSSEAREEKLMSEVRAALEMNVRLKGEIKSSEAREKKLMSEVRTAVERNVKLEGGINRTVSSLANLVKKSRISQSGEAQDDDSTVHEAEGDLQEELHSEEGIDDEPEKHMAVEINGKKVSHVKDSTSGKSTKISSSSKGKAKMNNEESEKKSSKSSEKEQGTQE